MRGLLKLLLILSALSISTVVGAESFGLPLPQLSFPPRLFPALYRQGVAGNVAIENSRLQCQSLPAPTASPQLVVHSSSGYETVSISWTRRGGCLLSGNFLVQLRPGSYTLSIPICGPPGSMVACRLLPWPPMMIRVHPGRLTTVNIRLSSPLY
jgi:hypothetical protein